MNIKKDNFLEDIRLSELEIILDTLKQFHPTAINILEIGAGTGWQARELSKHGYKVTAIDIPDSNHSDARIWEILDFDGKNIPATDNSFDIVYSSNVLEHVLDLDALNQDIHRVLKTNGHAIHYVPTGSWRSASLIAFYPSLIREVIRRIFNKTQNQNNKTSNSHKKTDSRKSFLKKALFRIFPHAHGTRGSALNETVLFKKLRWEKLFKSYNWEILFYTKNKLFLTGEMILGHYAPVKTRSRLSNILGSSAHLYVLKPSKNR